MPIAASLLPEYDHEMKSTRAVLERVPDAKGDWKPHAKSMSMSQLAIHLPSLLNFIPVIMHETEIDFLAPAMQKINVPWSSTAAALQTYDRLVAEGRALVATASDEAMMVPWTMRAGDHVMGTMPRVAALRGAVFNHLIHHRGQLTVYLRLNDIALPEIYGPTADSMR